MMRSASSEAAVGRIVRRFGCPPPTMVCVGLQTSRHIREPVEPKSGPLVSNFFPFQPSNRKKARWDGYKGAESRLRTANRRSGRTNTGAWRIVTWPTVYHRGLHRARGPRGPKGQDVSGGRSPSEKRRKRQGCMCNVHTYSMETHLEPQQSDFLR